MPHQWQSVPVLSVANPMLVKAAHCKIGPACQEWTASYAPLFQYAAAAAALFAVAAWLTPQPSAV